MIIYIVEDDNDIREMESYALKNSGYEVIAFADSADFYKACEHTLPNLVLLDIMLSNEDGLSILRKLRQNERTKQLPIIMVTAKTTELDKVRGLDMGADDYITKPFGIMELVSRVKALLRRASPAEAAHTISFNGISLDDEKRTVTVDDIPCELTYKEFELLKLLLKNADMVLSREKIMDIVWGFDYHGESRTVDMHIKTLRQKLGEKGNCIKTIRNVGYKISQTNKG